MYIYPVGVGLKTLTSAKAVLVLVLGVRNSDGNKCHSFACANGSTRNNVLKGKEEIEERIKSISESTPYQMNPVR